MLSQKLDPRFRGDDNERATLTMKSALEESNLIFELPLSPSSIGCRKLKLFLGWLVYALLVLFGCYGIFNFINNIRLNIFYWSLLTDMFLFYLIQRSGERAGKMGLPPAGEKTNTALFLSSDMRRVLESAWLLCRRRNGSAVRPIHLFLALIRQKNLEKILRRLNCEPKQIREKTRRILEKSVLPRSNSVPPSGTGMLRPAGDSRQRTARIELSAELKKIFIDAYIAGIRENRRQVGMAEVLWAMSSRGDVVGMVFDEFEISAEEIRRVVQWAMLEEKIKKSEGSFLKKRIFKPAGKLDRAMTATLTPFLDRVSKDLTALARRGEFEIVLGREKEVKSILDFFSAGKTAVVLVGPDEIGKKSIFRRLAQMMTEENVPEFLQDKRLVELDLGSLVGMKNAGEKGGEFLKRALFEVEQAGNIILAVERVDSLAGLRSGEGGLEFSGILASVLNNQTFFFLGSCTPEGFSAKIEGKPLHHVLSRVPIAPLPRNMLWKILAARAFSIERKLKVLFSVDAIDRAIELAERYLYGKSLAARAIDLLVEAASAKTRVKGSKLIDGEDMSRLVSQKIGMPLGGVEETEKERLLHLEELIHERLINQNEAVKAVAEALRRSRIELKERRKTIANFLFVGPTGVGKTELAKTLSRAYFGEERRMIRLDMSEYQEKRSLRRLLGLRSDEGIEKGYLTETIKQRPHSLLLLDELEKAHPDILNVFLQVMDDGRLTDAAGQTINFTDVMLIATSNAGTRFVQERMKQGAGYEEICQQLKSEVLLKHFRPEFLNRFDKIVLFRGLSIEHMMEITGLFLREIQEKLEEKGITLQVEPEAVSEIASAGYDPLYGARPLKRVIQDRIESPVARLFLEDKLKRRDTLILKPGFEFEVKKGVEL